MLRIIILLAIAAMSKDAQAKPTPKVVFVGKAGETLSLETAMQVSARGETVYRCQAVKATVSKTGTSITFKVVKD